MVKKILVVDDDADTIVALDLLLTQLGFEVHGFTDPVEALINTQYHVYDFALVDHNMPDMTGGELAAILLSSMKVRKVIGFSGYASQGDFPNGCLFLEKPLSAGLLGKFFVKENAPH